MLFSSPSSFFNPASKRRNELRIPSLVFCLVSARALARCAACLRTSISCTGHGVVAIQPGNVCSCNIAAACPGVNGLPSTQARSERQCGQIWASNRTNSAKNGHFMRRSSAETMPLTANNKKASGPSKAPPIDSAAIPKPCRCAAARPINAPRSGQQNNHSIAPSPFIKSVVRCRRRASHFAFRLLAKHACGVGFKDSHMAAKIICHKSS